MIGRLLVLPLVLLVLFSCKDSQNSSKINSRSQPISLKKECLNTDEKVAIIKSILSTKNINSYLHLELAERNPIRLIKNDFTGKLDSFYLNLEENKVIFVDSIPIIDTNLLLRVEMDSCTSNKGNFVFYSPIENAEVNGNLKFEDSIWAAIVLKDIEF
jgi:hypothetical protein